MGRNSSIEWTDHTFNPWWGCARVSPGCENCYAETWAKRVGAKIWGTAAERRFFTDKHWREPLKWNHEAEVEDVRRRVFCASMADVFEGRADLDAARSRLWELIGATKHLDWLLLTKRPENIKRMAPWARWPTNVWIGTTVEDQKRAELRLPYLLEVPATKRFLSCEPLIAPVNLDPWLSTKSGFSFTIDWVIAGGESGAHARPMLPSWARTLRDQCKQAGVPFHFKQWGHWAPVDENVIQNKSDNKFSKFWDEVSSKEILMKSSGKKEAGRDLDGRTWDELPEFAYG